MRAFFLGFVDSKDDNCHFAVSWIVVTVGRNLEDRSWRSVSRQPFLIRGSISRLFWIAEGYFIGPRSLDSNVRIGDENVFHQSE